MNFHQDFSEILGVPGEAQEKYENMKKNNNCICFLQTFFYRALHFARFLIDVSHRALHLAYVFLHVLHRTVHFPLFSHILCIWGPLSEAHFEELMPKIMFSTKIDRFFKKTFRKNLNHFEEAQIASHRLRVYQEGIFWENNFLRV